MTLYTHDAGIIEVVNLLGQVSTRQVERICFAHNSPNSEGRQARRTLKRLVDTGYISRLKRSIGGDGSEGYTYVPAQAEIRTPDLHTLDVSEVYTRLREAEAAGRCEIKEFEVEEMIRGTRTESDAYLWTRTQTTARDWYLEIDRGSHKRPKMQQKLKSYVKAYQQETENFPAVLYIVTDSPRGRIAERKAQIKEWIRQVEHPAGLFTVCTLDEAIALLTQ